MDERESTIEALFAREAEASLKRLKELAEQTRSPRIRQRARAQFRGYGIEVGGSDRQPAGPSEPRLPARVTARSP
jgi:hypothetical protein